MGIDLEVRELRQLWMCEDNAKGCVERGHAGHYRVVEWHCHGPCVSHSATNTSHVCSMSSLQVVGGSLGPYHTVGSLPYHAGYGN